MPANPKPLVALVSEDAVWGATVSMSDEDPDPLHAVEMLQDRDPATTAKTDTASTTTITITTSSITPVAIALINTNATTASLNGDPITIPALDLEGQRVHGWLDMRGSPMASGTVWTLVLTRPSGVVWIGRVCLVTALHELNLKYGYERGRDRPGDIEITTRLGSNIYHSATIRTNWAQGVIDLHEDEALLSDLDLAGLGKTHPMLYIPDEDTNEAWFARQVIPYAKGYPNIDVRETKLRFEEMSGGPPNG